MKSSESIGPKAAARDHVMTGDKPADAVLPDRGADRTRGARSAEVRSQRAVCNHRSAVEGEQGVPDLALEGTAV